MRLVFLGAPGAGKGTQAKILAEQWQITHISCGDILRRAIAEKTSLGIQAQVYVDVGELVPDILVIAIIRELFERPDIKQGWILDGFPRNLSQALALEELLQESGQPYDWVINFEVSTKILIQRMLARDRLDDSPITIRRRLQVYQHQSIPLIEYYHNFSCLKSIDGNLSVSDVTRSLQELL